MAAAGVSRGKKSVSTRSSRTLLSITYAELYGECNHTIPQHHDWGLRNMQQDCQFHSNSSMHHCECIALGKDISLQRGWFCTRSLASYTPRSSEDRSSRKFFIQVVQCARPPRGLPPVLWKRFEVAHKNLKVAHNRRLWMTPHQSWMSGRWRISLRSPGTLESSSRTPRLWLQTQLCVVWHALRFPKSPICSRLLTYNHLYKK